MKNIVIIGGTLNGIDLALSARKAGHEVTIVTATTYIGDDITRTWSSYGLDRQGPALDRLQQLGVPIQGIKSHSGQLNEPLVLLPGKTKRELLCLLRRHGVNVLFMSHFAGLKLSHHRVIGALIANKFGVQNIQADQVVDATVHGSATCSIAGIPIRIQPGHLLSFSLEYFGYSSDDRDHPIPGVFIHQGMVRPDQVYVTIQRACPYEMTLCQAQIYLRLEAASVACRLHEQVPSFARAYLAGAMPDSIAMSPTVMPVVKQDGFSRCASRADGLSILQYLEQNDSRQTEQVAVVYRIQGQILPETDFQLDNYNDPLNPMILQRVQLPLDRLNLPCSQYDVLIAGGGTAGLCAATAAAQAGLKVGLVEFFGNLGGTRTLGGVSGFYFGNRNKLFQSIVAKINSFSSQINAEVKGKQTIVAEMLYYNMKLAELAVDVTTASVICAVSTEQRAIRSVLSVGEYGLSLHHAKLYIDATGDGDLAVLTGTETDYGDKELGCTQNYSQWHRNSQSRFDLPVVANLDQGVLDSRYFTEWNRAILYNTLQGPDYDWSEMLTVRESRHIRGRFQVCMRDVVRNTPFPDVICSAYSDYDPHSHCFSIIGRLGLMPQHAPNRWVDIPLGSLLPEQIDNLLVVAKAMSFDPDVFNYIRMNPDVMSLGAVAGMLATESVQQDRLFPNILLTKLQLMLRDQGVIHEAKQTEQFMNCADRIIDRLADGDESAFSDAVLTEWNVLPERLLSRYNSGHYRDEILLLKTLLWFGYSIDTHKLIAKMEQLAEQTAGKAYDDRNHEHNGNIKGGIIGPIDDYWLLNQLILILSRAQIRQATVCLRKIIDQTTAGGPPVNESTPYLMGRIDNQCIPHYDRVLNIAEAIQAMPAEDFREPLDRLLNKPYITGYCRKECSEPLNFHMALMELKLAIGAARCGSDKARQIICDYTQDVHLTLSQLAQRTIHHFTFISP